MIYNTRKIIINSIKNGTRTPPVTIAIKKPAKARTTLP